MANFNNPQLNSTYVDFLSQLKDRDTDLAAMFANDTVSVNNWPARSVRFNTTSNKFQRRNANNNGFEDLTTNHHFPAVTIDGTGSLTVGGAISGASINVTGLVSGGRINATGSTETATGLYRPATNTLGITTNTVLRWAIDSVGRLFNNGQATHQGDDNSDLQIYNTGGGRIDLLREDTSVVAGNGLGQIRAYTNETADNSFNLCANILIAADNTFTNTSHPTRIQFNVTPINSTTVRTVGCFDQAGFFGLGEDVGANPSYPFHLNGGGTNNTAFFKSTDTNMFIGLADDASSSDFHNRIAAIGNEIQIRANGATTPHLALTDTFRVVVRKSSEGITATGSIQQHHLQVFGTDANGSLGVSRGSGNGSPPTINLYKYRSTGYGLTAAQIGDAFGDLNWYASDGTQMQNVCRVRVNSLATDFSGNSTAVSTGAVPSAMSLRVLNNDGGNLTFFQVDHNGHIKLQPHPQPAGAPQNTFFLDIRANNTNGAGNLIRFTETDTTVAADRILGGIQFASADTNAVNSGLLGEIRVTAESGNPVHGIMGIRMAGTEHITIEGLNNHLGIHRSDPEFPLDVVGNTLIDGSLCVSNDRAGFINMNDSAALQVTGNTNAKSMVNITRFSNNTGNCASLVLTKNHSDTATGNTATLDNSVLGMIEFQGANGTGYSVGSRIKAQAAAAFGTGQRSTDLHFMVATNNNLNTYMILTNYGALHVGDNISLDVDYSNTDDARLVLVDQSGPDLVLHRRDSETQNTNQIGRLVCSDSDGGTPAPPSAKIEFVASQNHSSSAKGTDIVFGMCENGSNTITNRFVFRDSGAFAIALESGGDTVGDSGDVLVSKGNNPPEYAPVGAKAWVSFDGDVSSNNNSDGYERAYNVSSVTDNDTGDYTINWDTNFSNNQYAMVVSVSYSNHIHGDGHGVVYIISQSNGNARIKVNSEDSGSAVMDKDIVNVVAFH